MLPAYNEEAVIDQTVRHVADVLGGLVADFEIVVTNDGSRDRPRYPGQALNAGASTPSARRNASDESRVRRGARECI